MKRDADVTQFDSLKAIYADLISRQSDDPIEKILVMTYEFDDQQLLNLICARPLEDDFELRRNQRKYIADLKPVILYDARKTREFNRLPHFLDLVPVHTQPFSCHHSKAYLVVTRSRVRLVLGSLNLTYSGLFRNREVFKDFSWSRDDTDDLQVLRDFAALLERQRADIPQAATSTALAELLGVLTERLALWTPAQATPSRHTLLASGPGNSGLARLADLWRALSPTPPKRLFAVSPFFDQGQGVLIDMLDSALGVAQEVHLITDERNLGAVSKRHFGVPSRTRQLNLITSEIADAERTRIECFNDGRSTQGLHLERKLHAKILVIEGDGVCLVYLGSANFTSKAWNGDNFELGVAFQEPGGADAIIDGIRMALAATAENHYDALPAVLAATSIMDDEDYVAETGYPEFIDRIVLHYREADETVHFEIHGEHLDALTGYAVSWGSLALALTAGRSQDIPASEFYVRLVGGRNLCFASAAQPGRQFPIPFWHAPELVQKKDEFTFPNSEDWLLYYLGIGGDGGNGGGPGDEQIPGEPVVVTSSALFEVDRENNVVIRMQRYLSLFAGIESVFVQKADAAVLLSAGDGRIAGVRKQIAEPITAYAKILRREFQQGRHADVARLEFCFKLGELLLFLRTLVARLPELGSVHAELTALLDAAVVGADAGLQLYVNHCTGKN